MINEDFFYIQFEIRSSNNHPVIMSGVLKQFDVKKLSKENPSLFVKSFYADAFFVPDLFNGYNKMLNQCLGKEKTDEYLRKNPFAAQKIINNLNKKSLEKTINLVTGEIVYISITKVSAVFWGVDKNNGGISTSSNEFDIFEIDEIKKCYVPFEVKCYTRPKRKEILE
ncbi:hypothetical protein [Flavobacterium suncheonense]|uniref:hypothetical protein n=1 Tax=Flavobacterium suncheonense TaxID=350894 RepID=UPI003FA3A47A